jgi:hypothetical protein
MLANMQIGLRLTLGFAIVLALMAALAAVGKLSHGPVSKHNNI